jgi:hypothetical protein
MQHARAICCAAPFLPAAKAGVAVLPRHVAHTPVHGLEWQGSGGTDMVTL